MIVTIRWCVQQWNQIGQTIWYPTANIHLNKAMVSDWTYKINIIIEWEVYKWAWSANNKNNLFESHIFDFNENIYGREIEIIILEKIRENKKFKNIDELKRQITSDIQYIKEKRNHVLTFWTFDLVHEWHKYFLIEAKKYADILVTILATDTNIEKFKGKKPMYNIEERVSHIKELNISDIVVAGDESHPLKWINIYSPTIICLGYDQKWFSS